VPATTSRSPAEASIGYTGLIESPASQAKILAELLTEAAAGKLVVPVELVPLAQAQSAFERILERRVTGKLVLDTSS
jgi:D-arabinose 1-dehydrogenase-like Zn-dependent alcohol dehydrogenase